MRGKNQRQPNGTQPPSKCVCGNERRPEYGPFEHPGASPRDLRYIEKNDLKIFFKFFQKNIFFVHRFPLALCTIWQTLFPSCLDYPWHFEVYGIQSLRCKSGHLGRVAEKQSPFEIARDRAEIRVARRRQALSRGMIVPKHCAERRHGAAREISCDSQRISDRNFRKIFAAAKFCVRNRARSRRNPRCPTTPSLAARHEGPQTLCRASACCGA